MNSNLLSRVPAQVRNLLGSGSTLCLLNGTDVFSSFRNETLIIMACNARIGHVIPGIMQAAEELDAVIAFELTKTEGGLDGGYTGMTPSLFFETLVSNAERINFSKPFILHADHITIKDSSTPERLEAQRLIEAQLAAGFTSFAIDASFNDLHTNIQVIEQVAGPILSAGYSLEVELGEVKPVGTDSDLTTVEETQEFLSTLTNRGIQPQLLAINNGSKTGNYIEGQIVNIDLERTRRIHEVALSHGLSGLVQHGITGTPLRIVGKLADFGIRKGNIGTLWQNVVHAGLPLDLMDAMRRWARENRCDIKYATRVFKADIDAIPEENVKQIQEMAYRETKEFITAFGAKGSATKLANILKDTHCA